MYTITEQQRNSIANYLATRPYAEVVQLISLLSQLPPVSEKEHKESKKDKK